MPTYCQATDVQAIIQTPAFSGSTTPTQTQVEDFIDQAEAIIDRRTNHSWKENTVTNEFYDLPYPYPPGDSAFAEGNTITVYLRKRAIRSLSSGSGDKVEIWNGSSYDDWLTTKTEGRANDFWIELDQGNLYLKYYYPYFTKKALRMTYRYGESSVPDDIKKAAALIASILVLQSDDRSAVLSETGDVTRENYETRISQWNKEIDRILLNRTEIIVV